MHACRSTLEDPTETLARALDGRALLVVDEAYVEFGTAPSFTTHLAATPNAVVLRTLSKAGALAGARCGVAIGHPDLIQVLQKVRAPYPIPAPILQSALAAATTDWSPRVAGIVAEREKLALAFTRLDIVDKVFPTEGNFILVRAKDGETFLNKCLGRGIVTRDRGREPGLKHCIRVTVGTPEENRLLVEALS